MTAVQAPPSLLGTILAALLLPGVARADGEFAALDFAEGSTNGVLSVSRGDLTFVASYTDYGEGQSAALSLTHRLPFDLGVEGLVFAAGPAVGFGGGDLSELSLGLTIGAQRYVPTDFGNYFLQANYSTIENAYFAQAQIGFAEPGLTLALERGASTEYEETSVSVSQKLGDSPVSLRAGYRFVAEEWFVGVSINTF